MKKSRKLEPVYRFSESRQQDAFSENPFPAAIEDVVQVYEENARAHRLGLNGVPAFVFEGGMAVSVGRVRECPILGYKFVALGHNTIRGAAGAAVLNAELMHDEGFFD